MVSITSAALGVRDRVHPVARLAFVERLMGLELKIRTIGPGHGMRQQRYRCFLLFNRQFY